MTYLIIILKILVIEYFILFFHEIMHFIMSLIFKFKITNFYLIPFNIYKKNCKLNFQFTSLKEITFTSRLHFKSINLSSESEYNILLKKLRIYLWIGPIYDFFIFVILFSIGVSQISFSYLALVSLIHFFISTINFFNTDGKYAIGSKEDKRIAFNLIRDYTICGSGKVSYRTKCLLTDIHMKIANTIHPEPFDVNDLWNFLNNISFYTGSLISYLNKDLLTLDSSTISFFNNLEKDFDNIVKYDYRQREKTSIAILYFYIYKKILDNSFIPNEEISKKIFLNIHITYYKKLYSLFFYRNTNNIEFLLNTQNMPSYISAIHGYNKLLLNLINIYKNNIKK